MSKANDHFKNAPLPLPPKTDHTILEKPLTDLKISFLY
jgi:hypothetical protein